MYILGGFMSRAKGLVSVLNFHLNTACQRRHLGSRTLSPIFANDKIWDFSLPGTGGIFFFLMSL
jgi:hypothetical protein